MESDKRDLIWHCRAVLLRCAAKARRRNPRCPLSTQSIVQEAWIRLRLYPVARDVSESHYQRIAARVMRYIVYDAAQRRKREREALHTELHTGDGAEAYSLDGLLVLCEALERLQERDERRYRIAIETWFAGCTAAEVAARLDLTESVVRHELRFLNAWRKGLITSDRKRKAG